MTGRDDAAVLERAAGILEARTRTPGGFWLGVLCKTLRRIAAKIREKEQA